VQGEYSKQLGGSGSKEGVYAASKKKKIEEKENCWARSWDRGYRSGLKTGRGSLKWIKVEGGIKRFDVVENHFTHVSSPLSRKLSPSLKVFRSSSPASI